MSTNLALQRALDLAIRPGLAQALRQQVLTDGVLELIKIAAGDPCALKRAASECSRDRRFIQAAAEHYLQQVIFSPDADCFRVLGVLPGATKQEMRTHLRWLMKWLHPDHAKNEWRTVFAARVLDAWKEARAPVVGGQVKLAPAAVKVRRGLGSPARRTSPTPSLRRFVWGTRIRPRPVFAILAAALGVAIVLAAVDYSDPASIGTLRQWFWSQTEAFFDRILTP